jgi:hypothetical protein
VKTPGKTAGVINGHTSIAPSSNASSTTEITSAFRRKLRARARDSASFSNMHCDKLPRSLTDTPPATRSYTWERHRGAAKKEMASGHAAGSDDSGQAASDGLAEFARSLEG